MASAYTEAWQPWNDRFADHVIAKRNRRLAFGAMALIALALKPHTKGYKADERP